MFFVIILHYYPILTVRDKVCKQYNDHIFWPLTKLLESGEKREKKRDRCIFALTLPTHKHLRVINI